MQVLHQLDKPATTITVHQASPGTDLLSQAPGINSSNATVGSALGGFANEVRILPAVSNQCLQAFTNRAMYICFCTSH